LLAKYNSGDQIKEEIRGHVSRVEERRSAHRVSVGKREGKRPLVIHRRRGKGNIRMGLQEVGCGHGLD
jgi:DNA-binding IclR family transcriptional regulator